MNYFFPRSTFYKDYTLQFFFKSKQITISYDMTHLAATHFGLLGPLAVNMVQIKTINQKELTSFGNSALRILQNYHVL
jgi:ACT domain-containing protein